MNHWDIVTAWLSFPKGQEYLFQQQVSWKKHLPSSIGQQLSEEKCILKKSEERKILRNIHNTTLQSLLLQGWTVCSWSPNPVEPHLSEKLLVVLSEGEGVCILVYKLILHKNKCSSDIPPLATSRKMRVASDTLAWTCWNFGRQFLTSIRCCILRLSVGLLQPLVQVDSWRQAFIFEGEASY